MRFARLALPALFVMVAAAGSASAAGLLIPEDEAAAAGDGQPQGDHRHRGPGGRSPPSSRPSATTPTGSSKRPTSSRCPRAPASTSSPCGSTARKSKGELVEADKAREIYTDIVRRTQDPGLLEYMGNNLLRLRVFPIPPQGRPEGEAQLHVGRRRRTASLVEYVYPLKTDGKATRDAGRVLASRRRSSRSTPIQNVYSPTHAITTDAQRRQGSDDRLRAQPGAARQGLPALLQLGDKDVGLTPLTHRPIAAEDGYFMLLISPQVEMSKDSSMPRDMVLVLDTSGSMAGVKMEQARKALKYCLDNLQHEDRFAPDQLRHHGQQVPRQARSRPTSEQLDARQEVGRRPEGDRRHRHQRRPDCRPGDAHRRRGPAVHHRLLHRRPADHRRDQPGEDRQERRRRRTRPTRASSPSASATTSTPPCSTSWPSRRGPSAPTSARPRTSRPRSAACTARSAIRCWPT